MDIFTDKHSGIQFCTKIGNSIADEIIAHGIHDYNLIKWCEQYVTPNGNFIDIGSHIGTYSIILGKKCKQVYSFDAQKCATECLTIGMCVNNAFNINIHNMALGSHEGTTTIYCEDGLYSTLRSDLIDQMGISIINEESVQMRTLDSYNLKNVDFLKIFVSGYELEVIKGAASTLVDNNFPPFMFEAWAEDWYKEDRESLISFVKNLGYGVYPVSGYKNMYLASDHDLRNKKPEEPKEPPKFLIEKLVELYESKQLNCFDINSPYLNPDWIAFVKEPKLEEWEVWHALARNYRDRSKHQTSYDCSHRGLKLAPPDKEYLFYEELSIVTFYLNRKGEGYHASDKVTLSHAPWSTRNYTLNNQSYYMERLPFKKVISMDYPLPLDYIGSSSSIIPCGEGYRLNLRGVNYTVNDKGGYIIRDPENIVRTRNLILSLDKDLKVCGDGVELIDVSGIQRYPKNIQGIEDIRLFGTNEFFCTYLEVNDSRTPQICYCKYGENGEVTTIVPLMVGTTLKCEKNWLPFVDNGEIKFIYSMQPFRIYKLNPVSGELELIKESTISQNNIGDFRGSASPIKYKDGWLFTIHQVFHANPRKYFHRFIWMDSDFTTMKYSKVFFFEKPDIEFNLSICDSEIGLLVTYSVRDNCSKIGILNHEILESWLQL